jgi:hypothetical protein
MPDQSASATALAAAGDAAASRDCLPAVRPADGPELAPVPWARLSRAECLLWALALHRAAVAARLSSGQDR